MLIGGTTVVATGGAAVGTIPVTLGAVAGAAASGSSAGNTIQSCPPRLPYYYYLAPIRLLFHKSIIKWQK